MLSGGVLFVVIIASTVVVYIRHRDAAGTCSGVTCTSVASTPPTTSLGSSIVTSSPPPTPTPTPLTASKLNGAEVPVGTEALHPLAVMIENHPDARPQSGLASADLVYEAIAEGGITRFMAVFGNPQNAVRVGPIRSARTYFVDFATELNAFYAHVGGNADALDQIKATNVFDLDEFAVGSPTYQRDFSRNVATEHTMYSSTDKLWNVATQTRKWSQSADYQSWNFADDTAPSLRPPSEKPVTINFSNSSYQVIWNYDPTTNSYSRNLAGKPHIDANTNTQITAKDIVIETVQHKPTVTRSGEQGWIDTLTGTGSGVIIHDGTATAITWKKTGTERTRYYTSDGKEVTFTRGAIWVEITHPETSVSY